MQFFVKSIKFKPMKKLLIIQLLFISFACDSANEEYANDANIEALDYLENSFEALEDIQVNRQSQFPQAGKVSEEVSKKVINSGSINFQSAEIEKDYQAIIKLLPQLNAYIESERQSKNAYRINYDLTVRVASNNYESLFKSLVSLATRLDSKSSNIEDVTERFYDLKTRIKNKEILEIRYLELLKKASEVKDILLIEKNLNEVRTDIERMKGQFNLLSKQISLSTIHLSFHEVLPYSYDSPQRKGFGVRILNSLDNGWQGFLSFLVGVFSLWPFIVLTVSGIYVFFRVRKRLKNNK